MAPHAGRDPRTGAGEPFRPARLLKHADFQRVYKQGKRQFTPHMTVFYLAREHGGMRVGYTVGKVLGTAVVRNRIKRRMREAVRAQARPFPAGVDLVIHPKKSAGTAEFALLVREVDGAFALIGQKLAAGG